LAAADEACMSVTRAAVTCWKFWVCRNRHMLQAHRDGHASTRGGGHIKRQASQYAAAVRQCTLPLLHAHANCALAAVTHSLSLENVSKELCVGQLLPLIHAPRALLNAGLQ
jgi:hypothetical protein